jgi:hypothetical protein
MASNPARCIKQELAQVLGAALGRGQVEGVVITSKMSPAQIIPARCASSPVLGESSALASVAVAARVIVPARSGPPPRYQSPEGVSAGAAAGAVPQSHAE